MLEHFRPKLAVKFLDGFEFNDRIKMPAYAGDVGYDLATNLPTKPATVAKFIEEHKSIFGGQDPLFFDNMAMEWIMPPHSFMDVPVGISCEIINDMVGVHGDLLSHLQPNFNVSISIRPRSSTWKKRRINVMLGTIDIGYRGPWMFALHNPNAVSVRIKPNEYLAQAVFELNLTPTSIVIVDKLSESERGSKGFGSSNK